MIYASIGSSLLAWSEQVFVLAAAGAAASIAIAHPKARLLLWQVLLVAMLLLPFAEPWKTPPVEAVAAITSTAITVRTSSVAPATRLHWRNEYLLWLFAAGAALRLLWAAVGFARLRRYRMHAQPIPAPALRSRFAAAARWYLSDSVPGPVTYGWRKPVILLPSRVLDLPAAIREAIECHELIHVRRGDWLFVLGEAVVRSLAWFHPGVWFVLGRIQLAREQAVDQEAVGLLENRDQYLDALVAVAEYQLQPDLTPAPLFLRKRHLAARVDAVIKEIKMSRSRIAAAVAAVCSAVPVAVFAAMWWFPFTSVAQTSPDSPGVTVEAGATLLHRAPVRIAASPSPAGTVIVQATLDAKGEVTDAVVLSGPQELRRDVLSSVLQWHYQPGPSLAQISVRFEPTAAPAPAPVPPPSAPPGPGGRGPALSTSTSGGILKSIEFAGISSEAEQQLRNLLPVHEGDVITRQQMPSVTQAVRSFDSHLDAMFSIAANGDVTRLRIAPRTAPNTGLAIGATTTQTVGVGITTTSTTTSTSTAAAADDVARRYEALRQAGIVPPSQPRDGAVPAPAAAAAAVGAYPARDGVTSPIPTYKIDPQYSEEARKAKWQGSVLISTVIDETGKPQDLKVVRPLGLGLDEKAIEAVSQWRFQPGTKDGAPVRVAAQIEVTFRLADNPPAAQQ